jgi:hypothetical protein
LLICVKRKTSAAEINNQVLTELKEKGEQQKNDVVKNRSLNWWIYSKSGFEGYLF